MCPKPGEGPSAQDEVLARLVRREAGLLVASLHRRLGDFDLAEEAVQEATTIALRAWRRDGVPPNPGGWLATTARRRAIDLLRRRTRESRLAEELAEDPTVGVVANGPGDERLPMLFGCCHPALGVEARVALTLRAVVGMSTVQIARAFLVPEATMAQRLVRAKRKIATAGIPFTIPKLDQLAPRLDDVLTVVYLSYNAGYLDPSAAGTALTEDAVWLAELVARALPEQPEAWGLLSLLTFLSARTPARFDETGGLVRLEEQDRTRWDAVAITRADGYLVKAASLRQPGRYQLQAALAGVHAGAPTWAATDWLQIAMLYDMLATLDRSPVVRLNQAIAMSHVCGTDTALAAVDELADRLEGYHLFHAARAELLDRRGDHEGAQAANARALELTDNPAEQALLLARMSGLASA